MYIFFPANFMNSNLQLLLYLVFVDSLLKDKIILVNFFGQNAQKNEFETVMSQILKYLNLKAKKCFVLNNNDSSFVRH